jgi:4-hydroxybenzoate polyprenyltransferase
MWSRVRKYGELIRFSHTLFALPFALLASFWAWIVPTPSGIAAPPFRVRDLVGILLCMVMARSFAMAMNRLLDEKYDAANPRTAQRHLPAGLLGRLGSPRLRARMRLCLPRQHLPLPAQSAPIAARRSRPHLFGWL